MFCPTYHHLTKLKYKFVTECQIEKCDVTMKKLKSQYCRDILPVYDRLESGKDGQVKGVLLQELARTELSLLAVDLSQKKISKEDYMKEVKPYIALQLKSAKMIKLFSF